MKDESKSSDEEPFINCEVCRKEIPRSVAQTYEGEEYVMHFCGLECYDSWKAPEQENKSETKDS